MRGEDARHGRKSEDGVLGLVENWVGLRAALGCAELYPPLYSLLYPLADADRRADRDRGLVLRWCCNLAKANASAGAD
jgi:hypothetical protein